MINRWTLFILIIGGEIELVAQSVWVAIPFILAALVTEILAGLTDEQKKSLKEAIEDMIR